VDEVRKFEAIRKAMNPSPYQDAVRDKIFPAPDPTPEPSADPTPEPMQERPLYARSIEVPKGRSVSHDVSADGKLRIFGSGGPISPVVVIGKSPKNKDKLP